MWMRDGGGGVGRCCGRGCGRGWDGICARCIRNAQIGYTFRLGMVRNAMHAGGSIEVIPFMLYNIGRDLNQLKKLSREASRA